MASKNANSRHTQTPSSPVPSSSSPPLHQNSTSKLPRFLQNKAARDRSKSVTDPGPGASGSSPTGSAGSGSPSPEPFSQQSQNTPKPKKTSKFLSINKKSSNANAEPTVPMPPQPHQQQHQEASMEMDEPPVIVEPVPIPRPRTRSERPVVNPEHSSVPTLCSSASSTSRIGDLPTRLSGWFTQTFSTSSTTDLSLPSVLAQQAQSPRKLGGGGGASALLTAAKHGTGHLDKAMRYLFDSDAVPDKCTDLFWLLGVQHLGYEPPPTPTSSQQVQFIMIR
ncbi:hypothetical protein D9613_010198 [Agrocybe pediades]|uniref:Uncharacterized protein n=1 Tax=Agrocybe pediades TaxID=84607 RepID=A0A8H4VJ71_9AGAR|nr:hypothetical protein D9613_010198 [Agrocybe pediades]